MIRLPHSFIKNFIPVIFLFITTIAFGQKAYTVAELPDPKKHGGGWVSDPDQILTPDDILQINSTISTFESKTNVQVAIVIVKDFDHNQEDFDFAYHLFNTWGIGSKTSNNGLLLFIAKDRRKYRFITGTGIEGVLPDVKLKHLAEQNLIPAFRENNLGTGIINTIDAIGIIILNPDNHAELNQFFTQKDSNSSLENFWIPMSLIILGFWITFKIINRQDKNEKKSKSPKQDSYDPVLVKGCAGFIFFGFLLVFAIVFFGGFDLIEKIKLAQIPIIAFIILSIILFFRYLFFIASIRNQHQDDKNFFNAVKAFHQKNWWLIFFSPFIIFAIIRHLIKRAKTNDRFKPVLDSKNDEMIRVDRDINIEGSPYLTPGQRKEEVEKVYDYDIWENTEKTEHVIKKWPAEKFDDYLECPACGFKTYKLNKKITTKSATYSHEGQAKIINECSFCKKTEFIRWITLPMLVKSSSSSSGSSSSGSSSSASSSSSWGGGSSSGGGTGGSW